MLQLDAPLRYIRKALATATKTVHVRPSSTTLYNVRPSLGRAEAQKHVSNIQRSQLSKKAAA